MENKDIYSRLKPFSNSLHEALDKIPDNDFKNGKGINFLMLGYDEMFNSCIRMYLANEKDPQGAIIHLLDSCIGKFDKDDNKDGALIFNSICEYVCDILVLKPKLKHQFLKNLYKIEEENDKSISE